MSVKVCAEPSCPELTTQIYCDQHRRDKRQASDRRRAGHKHNYGGARWRSTRRAYLRNHPLCEHDDCQRIASVVHHRDGEGLAGPRAYDHANLEALCKPHHDQHTAQAQPGGWHNPMN